MSQGISHAGGLAYRAREPEGAERGDPVLLVHGFPGSSYMWTPLLDALAAAGRRAIAPDLPGFGDTPPDRPGTWERQVEALDRFRRALDLGRAALVLHDWGGLIALRWACDNPGVASSIVVSGTGFFADGKWHGMASMLRTAGEGERLVLELDRDSLGAMLRAIGRFSDRALDECWKSFETEEGRLAVLDLYRSGDFEKLEPYRGKLAALEVPMLALWGAEDVFAPPASAHRFRKEVPGIEVVILEEVGHFAFADDPDACERAVLGFLERAD